MNIELFVKKRFQFRRLFGDELRYFARRGLVLLFSIEFTLLCSFSSSLFLLFNLELSLLFHVFDFLISIIMSCLFLRLGLGLAGLVLLLIIGQWGLGCVFFH